MKQNHKNHRKIRVCLLILAFIILNSINSIFAEIYQPVKWEFDVKYAKPGVADIYFNAKIEKNWHIYSNKIDGTGPVPTSIILKNSKDFSLIDSVVEVTKAEIKLDPGFGI